MPKFFRRGRLKKQRKQEKERKEKKERKRKDGDLKSTKEQSKRRMKFLKIKGEIKSKERGRDILAQPYAEASGRSVETKIKKIKKRAKSKTKSRELLKKKREQEAEKKAQSPIYLEKNRCFAYNKVNKKSYESSGQRR